MEFIAKWAGTLLSGSSFWTVETLEGAGLAAILAFGLLCYAPVRCFATWRSATLRTERPIAWPGASDEDVAWARNLEFNATKDIVMGGLIFSLASGGLFGLGACLNLAMVRNVFPAFLDAQAAAASPSWWCALLGLAAFVWTLRTVAVLADRTMDKAAPATLCVLVASMIAAFVLAALAGPAFALAMLVPSTREALSTAYADLRWALDEPNDARQVSAS